MKKLLVVGCWLLVACAPIFAETNVIDGVTYVCEGGICRIVENDEPPTLNPQPSTRVAQGYMEPDAFLSFLSGSDAVSAFGEWSWAILPLVFLGGLAMNLTPCVLPMIPINLMIIGKSAVRGLWYGLGITIAYGVLGVLAAVGGLAFGSIQSSPWFNLAVALVFVALALSLFGVFFIDFSKSRSKFRGGAFLMGLLAAVLAGACVAPILIAVLLWTAHQFASGNYLALGLPFVLGLGMALPWPFVGAGLSVLPKPGAWMKWVNRAFGIIVLGFAFWYGRLAWMGFGDAVAADSPSIEGGVIDATPATFNAQRLALVSQSPKPVLVDCWATWCKNCSAMERTTLADPKVRKALERYSVIRLQAEDINELRRQPGFESVMGLPAFVIFE